MIRSIAKASKAAWSTDRSLHWRGHLRRYGINSVAVGTPVARCPPHRSVREELPRTALTLGCDDQLIASRTPRNPMPRFPGTVSGASKVRLTFPLVGPLPSTDSAAAFGPALFARFFGTMGPSDSLKSCMSGVRQIAFPDRPAACDAEAFRVSRFPCIEFPRMRRVFDSATSSDGLRLSSPLMLPSPYKYKVGTPKQ